MDQLNAGGHQEVFPGVSKGKQDLALVELFAKATTVSGKTLLSLLDEKPMLLVFLRHFGSPSCRETLADMGKARPALEERGVRPVFVHMASSERARPFFEKVGLGDVERVSDPKTEIYQAPVFHLLKTTNVPEFFAGNQIVKLAKRAVWRHGMGSAGDEDATQMPGFSLSRSAGFSRHFGTREWRIDLTMFVSGCRGGADQCAGTLVLRMGREVLASPDHAVE